MCRRNKEINNSNGKRALSLGEKLGKNLWGKKEKVDLREDVFKRSQWILIAPLQLQIRLLPFLSLFFSFRGIFSIFFFFFSFGTPVEGGSRKILIFLAAAEHFPPFLGKQGDPSTWPTYLPNSPSPLSSSYARLRKKVFLNYLQILLREILAFF